MELHSITFPGLPDQYKVAPAAESADYPGCYYRTTNGVMEWVNPPMLLGVEYRTTERHNGNAVYAMLINFGALPNATSRKVSVGKNLNVIYLHGVSSNSNYYFDISTMPGVDEFAYDYWNGEVVVHTTADKSGYSNTYVMIKYTK